MKALVPLAALLSLGLLALPPSALGADKPRNSVAAAPAAAAALVPAQSTLGFSAKQMGVSVDGRFNRFDAQLSFDPRKPETGKVQFTIDLSSASLGDPMFDAELAKPAWFDSKKLREASFSSSAIKALGGGRFELAGKLSLKGLQRDLLVPLTLTQSGGQTTATGSFVLKRLDYKIGDGEWSDTSMVANEVTVKFKLSFTGIAAL